MPLLTSQFEIGGKKLSLCSFVSSLLTPPFSTADCLLLASFMLKSRAMKGITLISISLVLILISFIVPGRLLPADSSLSMVVALSCRVPGVICFIFGVMRLRREKQAA